MKKLLCLVFVLIALLGLAFAISAENRTNLANWDNSKLYNSDGSLRTEGKWGCTNGDTYMYNIFDGNKTDGIYLNNAGVYCLTDLNKSLLGGYYVTDIAISHIGGTKYSLYYKFGAGEWIPVVEDTKTSGTYTYSINDYATQVKYVFVEAPSWNKQLCEIEVFGIDPAEMTCEHPNLASQPWVEIPNSATCNDFGYQKQICPDCNEEFTRKTSEVPALGHDLSTNVTKPGTSASYGEGTIVCSRCDYAMDFKGEVDLTEDYYMSIGSSSDFVNVFVSSIADKWGASSIENMFNDLDGDWTCYNHETWFADSFSDEANYNDENEWADMIFTGNLDLTKIVICVPNDSAATLRISTYDEETGSYVVLKELPTYDESLPAGLGGITMTISMLGTTVDDLRIQVISPSKWHDGYQYYSMIIGELRVYGIAPGCGLDATNHECVFDKFVGYAENSAPTCQIAGKAVYQCTCNKQEIREVQPSEEFHNYIEVEGTRVNSTCTVAGSYTGTCEYCEDTKEFELELDNETGHNYEETGRTDATCIAVGSIEYKCSACEATKSEEIALVDHTYGEAVVVPSTCKVAGTSTVTCSVCGNEEVTALDLAAHAYDVETEDPTCEDTGLKTSTCVVCGDVQEEVIEKLGHTWVLDEDSIEVEPTCGEEGEGLYECTVCGNTKDDKIAPTGEHTWKEDYDEIIVPPTCEGTGAAQFSCVYCSATEKRGIKALGHDFSVEVEGKRVEATCTTAGSYEVTCANGCGKSQTKTIAALDHDWADATCAAPKTCKRENCGATEGGLADHTWTAASCTAPRTCEVCSETDGEALGHTYGWNIPVKNEAGEVIKTISHGCSVCYLEAKEDTDAEGNGLGYSTTLGEGLKILYAKDWGKLYSALHKVEAENIDFDVIRLTGSTAMNGTTAIQVYGEVIIDLGGNTITSPSNANWSMFVLHRTVAFGNGKLEHNGQSSQAIKTKNVDKIADLEIEVKATSGTVGGITSNGSYGGKECIGELTNVKIWGSGLTNHGIEAKNNGTTIGKMTNVYIESKGQAITIGKDEDNNNVSFGEMIDCTFKGGNIALDFGTLYGEFKMTRCTVHGGYITIKIARATSGATFIVTSDSTFTADNMLFDITDAAKANAELTLLETTVASVNGKLYDKIDNALEALKNSKEEVTTFALMANLELKSSIVIDKAVNFSLGGGVYYTVATGGVVREPHYADGYTITIADDTVGNGVFLVMPTGKLTLSGAGVVNAVCNSSNELDIAVWVYGGEAIINGNTFTNEGAGDDDQYDLIYVNNGGKLTINDGTFKCATPKWTLNMGDNSNSEIVVNGGIFYGYNPAEAYTEPNSPVSFVSDEIVCVYINEDGAYALATEHDYDHDRYTEDKECDEVRTGPTCTEWGYMTHTCRCGEYRIETLTDNNNKPLGHTAAAAVQENINNATCSAAGSYDSVVYCSVCNAEISRETLTIDALPHTEAIDQAVAPTCTATGLTEGKHCSVCGETLVAQTEVKMLDHNYVPVENEDGSTTYTCQNGCNDSYVINNAAINGTYYDDMDTEYVFANGKLTAMGSEFTYTYNVTTGMVELQETTKVYFFVINGTLCSRTRMPLHKHDKASLIKEPTAPTCTEKGYTTYICPISGPLFNDDYVDATGHSYGSMKIEQPTCTEDGYLQITCRTCKKTFVSPSPETDAYIDSQPSFITITIKPATGHTAAEAVREKVQNATCIAAGSYESVVYCSVCDAEISRTLETITALGHTPGEEVIENKKPATSTTAGSYDKVVYCVTCNTVLSRETVTVEPTCKHTNTEIIPAVPGVVDADKVVTPGMTSGVKCSDCGTVTVKPVVANTDLTIDARQLNISESIKIIYKGYATGYENVRMVFDFNGKKYEITEYTVDDKGRCCFTFTGVTPQYMNVNIRATIYADKDGQTSACAHEEYSVKTYCLNNLAKSSTSAKLRTLLTDLLIYGEMLQKYVGGACLENGLITEGVDLSAASTFAALDASYDKRVIPEKISDDLPYWDAASLNIANTVNMVFKFYADESIINDLVVKVKVKNRETTFKGSELTKDSKGRYEVKFTNVTAIEFDEIVTADFYIGKDKVEGATLKYTVNSYIQRNQNYNNAKLVDFLEALYNYGKAAYNYVH